MKRTALLLLAILMILPLAACGEKEPEYKYDNIPELVIDAYTIQWSLSRPIKGGALAKVTRSKYYGTDEKETEAGKNPLGMLFDENLKTLSPLCYDYTCEHDSDECFSYAFSGAVFDGYWNIIDDTIVIVNQGFSHHIVGDISPYDVYAWYFSLDGTLQKKVSFDMRTLVRQDECFAEKPWRGSACTSVGNKVFFDVCDASDGATETNEPQNHWVVCYDLDTQEFYSVANYVLPDSYTRIVDYTECTETKLGISYDRRYAYVINLEDGTYTETNCAEIYSRLISKGIAPTGWAELTLYPISNIIYCIPADFNISYYDIQTEQKLDSDENDRLELLGPRGRYYYDGKTVYSVGGSDTTNVYRTSDNNERITVERYFENDTYCLERLEIESENGLIFTYFNSGEWYDDEQYTVNEGGKEVVYQKAPRLVYVTKDDYFDGQIDDPWYYDAETGMFVQ